MSVELTVEDVEKWKKIAEDAIRDESDLQPVEGWPGVVLALIEGCDAADAQCRRLSRLIDKYEAKIDAAFPYIERDRKNGSAR